MRHRVRNIHPMPRCALEIELSTPFWVDTRKPKRIDSPKQILLDRLKRLDYQHDPNPEKSPHWKREFEMICGLPNGPRDVEHRGRQILRNGRSNEEIVLTMHHVISWRVIRMRRYASA